VIKDHERISKPAVAFASSAVDILKTWQHQLTLSAAAAQVVVAIFETQHFVAVARLPTHAPALQQLAWLSDGSTLLAAASDGRMLKWQGITVAQQIMGPIPDVVGFSS
jgi:hypothetical protein